MYRDAGLLRNVQQNHKDDKNWALGILLMNGYLTLESRKFCKVFLEFLNLVDSIEIVIIKMIIKIQLRKLWCLAP